MDALTWDFEPWAHDTKTETMERLDVSCPREQELLQLYPRSRDCVSGNSRADCLTCPSTNAHPPAVAHHLGISHSLPLLLPFLPFQSGFLLLTTKILNDANVRLRSLASTLGHGKPTHNCKQEGWQQVRQSYVTWTGDQKPQQQNKQLAQTRQKTRTEPGQEVLKRNLINTFCAGYTAEDQAPVKGNPKAQLMARMCRKGALVHCRWECKLGQPLGKTVRRSLKN